MTHIFPVKVYNENCPESRKAILKGGKERGTGYVLVVDDTATWFPNIGQAKTEKASPGKYPGRGVKL